ncbi:murein hydrolase activator EnvC family protein [Croceivirga thetidis]|uniref:Peptidoglycan DD-metalloendopeptidase family protein n=1 Tax=Croceivirga thetidis TaxID=2721623 RepID=A0ABX1GMN0_9FLAO|nr:peptidoglycan DD-metalloendopeptidase family protein [Croceivirga thetidis]NKI31153.1 peptidoglycan DD-metalloendopeptidase family protein [Croceivirga thetidis]
MRKLKLLFRILCVGFMTFGMVGLNAQSSEQQQLEAKKKRLRTEIRQINQLLLAERKEKGSVLEQVEALDQKINVSQELIRVTNQQANLLNRQINTNIRKIGQLKNELETLKKDYAQIIKKSYQNKNEQNRLMFLLSSDGFWQAYKRMQYLQQYANYRKQQGEDIVQKTASLTQLNKDLVDQRKVKEQLLTENRAQKNSLDKEINSQKDLLSSIRKNESKYAAQISERKKEERRIDREIERLIRSAIASSNKASGSSSTSSFELTPEAKALASDFVSNRGKLIWPVEKGIKSQGFGVYTDKVYPTIKHRNNGVTITTEKGAKARAVFKGEVAAIITNKLGKKGVLVRHGNYVSMYYNLSQIYVQKGDQVAAKEELGEIYTNQFSNSTKLKFYLYQDTKKLNPEDWIFQL